MRAVVPCAFFAFASAQQVVCPDGGCAKSTDIDGDAGALLQTRQHASVDFGPLFPTPAPPAPSPPEQTTRPSDIVALTAFWESVKGTDGEGKPGGCAPGWGDQSLDPCAGDATDPNNAQGFGQWKGVACVTCPDEPQYLCVAQIWLDDKCLFGTIPETFAGLTELWWLLLSQNNITGPLPTTNWVTLPKLVSIDLSHNTITGDLPLDSMKNNDRLRYIKVYHNMLDTLTYTGGGFKSLYWLKMIYNRNLTATFPDGFASIPHLRELEMHDTNISGGPVPTGPWRNLEMLWISGTGGLCGDRLPDACGNRQCIDYSPFDPPATYCDLTTDADFEPCDSAEADEVPEDVDVGCDGVTPTETRPSDVDALDNLWQSVKGVDGGNAPGWGNRSLDPCIGDATDPHNSQGFGQWKGVACVPCPEDPRYYCVSQIWLDGKTLKGRIPENFTGLTELWQLLLSNNHILGPLPYANWKTFPKLVNFDVSYNNITGNLPLNELSEIPTLRYIAAHHNMLDELCYHGGGFPELLRLNFIYNRNMTGVFPQGFSQIPRLRQLYMHDTHLRGNVPTDGWRDLQLLMISGTGGLCGEIPAACSRPGTHCDLLPGSLPPC